MSIPFQLQVEEAADYLVLHLRGALDHEADSFPPEVARAAMFDKPIIVDLSGVTSVQSMGIGMLVEGFKAARAGGRRIVFTGPRSQVRSVLEHTKLDTVLEIFPTLEDAVAALSAR